MLKLIVNSAVEFASLVTFIAMIGVWAAIVGGSV